MHVRRAHHNHHHPQHCSTHPHTKGQSSFQGELKPTRGVGKYFFFRSRSQIHIISCRIVCCLSVLQSHHEKTSITLLHIVQITRHRLAYQMSLLLHTSNHTLSRSCVLSIGQLPTIDQTNTRRMVVDVLVCKSSIS